MKDLLDKCKSDEQRDELQSLLENCEKYNVKYEIGKVVDLFEELEDFCNTKSGVPSIKEFYAGMQTFLKDRKNKFEFDLYFPCINNESCKNTGWLINVGTEIQDAMDMYPNAKDYFLADENGIEVIVHFAPNSKECSELFEDFREYLSAKYTFPSDKNEKAGWKFFLPWSYQAITPEDTKLFLSWPYQKGSVKLFMSSLFGDKLEAVIKTRKESYLAKHPVLRDKWLDMINQLAASRIATQSNVKALSKTELKNLAETVDRELMAVYPDYRKACLEDK